MAVATGEMKERELINSLAGAIRLRLVTPTEERLNTLDGRITHITGALEETSTQWRSTIETLEKRLTRLEEKLSRTNIVVRGLAGAMTLLLAVTVYLMTKLF